MLDSDLTAPVLTKRPELKSCLIGPTCLKVSWWQIISIKTSFSRKVVTLQKTSGDYLTCQADPHISSFHHLDLPAFQQLQQILVNPILPPKKLLFITIFVVNLFLIIFLSK